VATVPLTSVLSRALLGHLARPLLAVLAVVLAGVVGAVDDADVNIQTVLAAGQLAPSVRLVVRAGEQTDATLARRAGADEVIIPEVQSGEQVGTTV